MVTADDTGHESKFQTDNNKALITINLTQYTVGYPVKTVGTVKDQDQIYPNNIHTLSRDKL